MGFGGSGFKGGAGDLGSDLKINDGTIKIKEQANAETDTTEYGQIWVKTATPNQLYFTTDAGNDIQITSGTGLAAAASSAAVNADDIQTGDAAVTIETTVGNITLDAQATNADVIIKVDDADSSVTAVTFDGSDAGRAIFNGTITLGSDADGTDREIVFGHSTLKTIMGIDDSADAFVINTDDAFDGTLANNSLSIDASHNMIVAGNITSGGSFVIGSADMNETDLEKLDGITNGTAAANKAVVLDGSKNIATIGTVGCGAITSTGASTYGSLAGGALSGSSTLEIVGAVTSTGAIASSGSITSGGSFIIGSADMNETDLEKLDGITNGTAAANKAVVLDGSKNIATLGTVGCGAITSTGASTYGSLAGGALSGSSTLEIVGAVTSTGAIASSGSITAGSSFIIGSADMNETDLEKLDGITNGTAAANKAVVLDGSKNIATLGTVGCGAITSTGASTYGSLAGGALSGSSTLEVVGASTLIGAVNVSGAVSAQNTVTVGVDDTGYDVKFFGATSGQFMLWDESADELVLAGDSKLSFHDAAGGENIIASSDGHLEVNAGATLDMTAPTVDVNASTAVTIDTPGVTVTDTTATSATEGGYLRLAANDGAVMADNHRLGVIEFAGAEDTSNTISIGARIQAICRDAWDGSNNDADLEFYTTDGTTESLVLTLDADKLATFAGAAQFNGNATFGVDDTGVDVRMFSATADEGVLYDASEDELALLLTTKLKFHDVGGGEEIYASANGHLEVNAGTTLDMTAPTIDLNASTAVTIDTDTATFSSANASDPLIIVKNTTNDTNGARLKFLKDKGSAAADNDIVGQLQFFGDNDAQEETEYAGIMAQVADASDGTEGGRLVFRVATHDGTLEPGLTIADGDADEELDVTIGNGAASLTTVVGEMKVAEDFMQGDARRVIYEEVDVRHANATDDTVSVQFGSKIPQDSVVTRIVAMVKTVSDLGTHNVSIRFDAGNGRADT
jgi:hypothetical protein